MVELTIRDGKILLCFGEITVSGITFFTGKMFIVDGEISADSAVLMAHLHTLPAKSPFLLAEVITFWMNHEFCMVKISMLKSALW